MAIRLRASTSIIITVALFGCIQTASAALIVNSARVITEVVTVQPIVVSDDGGMNTAISFGTSNQQSLIESYVDTIWAQAGIDVKFRPPKAWNSTLANMGIETPRPGFDLQELINNSRAAGITSGELNVIELFFISMPLIFGSLTEEQSSGFAYIGSSGITQFTGSNVLVNNAGLERVAAVTSHEIGHNFGLEHVNQSENLMFIDVIEGHRLSSDQIALALASDLSVSQVPLPATAWFFATSVLSLIGLKRIHHIVHTPDKNINTTHKSLS